VNRGFVSSGCGIAGAVNCAVSAATLNAMTHALAHRGPDGRGTWSNVSGSVRFGHRRLAIVDVERGAQPMTRRFATITCNGEIYNYPELRRTLENLGCVFSSNCDTEVILHAYLQWGVECLDRLNGIFAFALYDAANDRLLLARDPAGVKPLVYCDAGVHGLMFASEVKALLAGGAPCQANFDVIRADLIHGFLGPKHETWFAGIHYLEPGHALIIDCATGKRRQLAYWTYPEGAMPPCEEADVIESIGEILHDSVRLQLLSDVGASVTCSGGIDSAAVAACMLRHTAAPLDTFTIEYEDDRQSASAAQEDLRHARMMAEANPRMRLNVVPIAMRKLITRERIDAVVRAFDGAVPFDLRVLSFTELYGRIREHGHKVTLIGQGADEMWLGYYADAIYTFYQFSAEQLSAEALATKFFLPRVPMGGFAAWNPEFLSAPLLLASCRANLERNYQSFQTDDPLTRISYFVARTHMQSILHVEDTMAMLNGIEARVPWLDRRMMELGFRTPSFMKLGSPDPVRKVKWLVREALRDILPAPIVERAKSPFPPPPGQQQLLRALLAEEGGRMQRSPFMRHIFAPSFLATCISDERRTERELFTTYLLWRFAQLYGL
jgi:asparagine synthase (glutamine-hydrolysing)